MIPNPAAAYLSRIGPGSRRTMASCLFVLAQLTTNAEIVSYDTVDWSSLRYDQTSSIRSILSDRFAPATANKHLAALRGVLRECVRLGLMTPSDFDRATDLDPIRGSRLPAGRALSPLEFRELFRVCRADVRPVGRRDAALLAVTYGCGLRRSEVVALNLQDLSPDGALRILRSKGNKDREVYAPPGTQAALKEWLDVRPCGAVPLFLPIRAPQSIQFTRLTDQAVLYIFQGRAQQAGLQPFSPHDLRRTYISDLIDAGADLVSVQGLAGHANVSTTARYDRRGAAARRRAAQLLDIRV